jgi:hypothetical protein
MLIVVGSQTFQNTDEALGALKRRPKYPPLERKDNPAMAHNYRTAKKEEGTCSQCKSHRVRPESGRLECPRQGDYQVGQKSTCDAFVKEQP